MRQVVIEHEQHDDPIITLLKQFNALGQFRALINPYCSRGERYGAKREPLKPTFRKIVKVGKMGSHHISYNSYLIHSTIISHTL